MAVDESSSPMGSSHEICHKLDEKKIKLIIITERDAIARWITAGDIVSIQTKWKFHDE